MSAIDQIRLAQSPTGRMKLHILACIRDGKLRYHIHGIIRELKLDILPAINYRTCK